MYTIGITGGVGAGKSQVMAYLKNAFDAEVLLADEVGHLVMKRGQRCYKKVRDLFGPEVVAADGELDRSAIAARVFGHPEQLEALNAIVHPAVKEYILEFQENQRKSGKKYFFLEAALLLEEKYDAICDEMWYVFASERVRAARLAQSRGYSAEKSRQIMANQLPEEVFRKKTDFVLDNSGDFSETERQIQEHMKELNRS